MVERGGLMQVRAYYIVALMVLVECYHHGGDLRKERPSRIISFNAFFW